MVVALSFLSEVSVSWPVPPTKGNAFSLQRLDYASDYDLHKCAHYCNAQCPVRTSQIHLFSFSFDQSATTIRRLIRQIVI